MDFSPELTSVLEDAFSRTDEGLTVLMLFEDMVEVNDRFQAVLDWFKARGNKMRRRYGQGAFLERGMIYFVGADTHIEERDDGEEVWIHTRGVDKEFDMRRFAPELVRQVGLEAKLRKKAEAKAAACLNFPDQPCLMQCQEGCARARQAATA
jgi:hypothetical protein